MDCKHPGKIENGRVIVMNGTTYNSAVEYHCIPQFERIGPYLRKCLESGLWSGEEPRCESKYLVVILNNLFVTNDVLLFVSEATGEAQDTSSLGTSIGIGAGIVLFLLILLGIVYLKLYVFTFFFFLHIA